MPTSTNITIDSTFGADSDSSVGRIGAPRMRRSAGDAASVRGSSPAEVSAATARGAGIAGALTRGPRRARRGRSSGR